MKWWLVTFRLWRCFWKSSWIHVCDPSLHFHFVDRITLLCNNSNKGERFFENIIVVVQKHKQGNKRGVSLEAMQNPWNTICKYSNEVICNCRIFTRGEPYEKHECSVGLMRLMQQSRRLPEIAWGGKGNNSKNWTLVVGLIQPTQSWSKP